MGFDPHFLQVLDVLPISQFPSETEDWEYPQDVNAAIVGGIGVGGVMNSSTNEGERQFIHRCLIRLT